MNVLLWPWKICSLSYIIFETFLRLVVIDFHRIGPLGGGGGLVELRSPNIGKLKGLLFLTEKQYLTSFGIFLKYRFFIQIFKSFQIFRFFWLFLLKFFLMIFKKTFLNFVELFWNFSISFLRIFGDYLIFFFFKFLRFLLTATEVTTEHKKRP